MGSHSSHPNTVRVVPLAPLNFTCLDYVALPFFLSYLSPTKHCLKGRPSDKYSLGYIVVLYSKSDKVPAHWPRRTLGPIHHVSPHPCEFKGETFKEQASTSLGEHLGELLARTSPRLKLELAHGKLVVELTTDPRVSWLTTNRQLTPRATSSLASRPFSPGQLPH